MDLGVLLLISTPGGTLSYDDHDIVVCQEASIHPGARVSANSNGQWRFVYITDRTCIQVMPLMQEQRSSEPTDEDPGAGFVSRRKYCCVLDDERAAVCGTYRPYDEAPPEQKMTWAEFEATYCVDKDG